MTRARLATGAAAVMAFFILIPPAPAFAAANVTVNIGSPTANFVSPNPAVLIAGTATIDSGLLSKNDITGVSVQVHGPVGPFCAGNMSGPGCGFSYVQGQATANFSFQPTLPYNGPYSATVTVSANEYLVGNAFPTPRNPPPQTVNFKVGVAPARPVILSSVVNGDRSVTVTWKANPELDLLGYQVQGSDGSKSSLVKPGSALAWTDTATTQTGGKYTYTLFVARAGIDGPTGTPISSASNPSGVDVPAPPPPPTTADGGTVPPLITPTPTSVGSGPGISSPTAPSLDLSGFLAKNGGSTPRPIAPSLPKLVTPGEQIAPDTGFQPTLPFPITAGRSGQGGKGGAGTPGALGAEAAGSSHSTTRTVLLPFAAGLFLCVVGIHLRWFNKRLGGDGSDPSLLPVEDVPTGGSDILPSPAPVVARPVQVGAGPGEPAPTPLDDDNVLVTW